MPTFSRPSAATLVAIVLTLVIGTQASFAASSSKNDRFDPRAVSALEVTAADASSVTLEWPPSRFEWRVAGYAVYVDGARVATVTPDRVHRWRDRDSLSYTVGGLSCGRGYTIGVDVFDREDDHSDVVSTTVSTAACPDTAAPSAPIGVRQVATTESSVMLAWTPSSDNVGVVEYGLYDSGLRVATVSDASATVTNLACGKTYLLGIDAADAAGNRSGRSDSYFRTAACPRTNQPPSTPTGLKVTGASRTGMTLAWSPSTDDVSVAGYGVYVSGSKTTETAQTTAGVTGLACGTTYAVGVDAYDGAGKRSSIAQLSTATSPCSTTPPPPPPSSGTGTIAQTIASGATLSGAINWRAVYDANGDKVPDDPGSVRFLVDGAPVLTEINVPFGDTDGFWNSTSVADGRHSFQVLALNDAGAQVASNTVSATVANSTTTSSSPPPPANTSDTTPPSTPGNARVVSSNGTGITIAWNSATDNIGVAGYHTYRGTSQAGQTSQTTTTYGGLSCGTAYQLGVDAYDAAGNKSPRADLAASTAACADTTPPAAPANVTVSNRSTTSIALTWAASTDNTAVAGYGVYNAGDLVSTTAGTTAIIGSLACGTNYTLAVDAFDTAGNSSGKTTVMVSTLACGDTTPPAQPTGVKAVSTTTTSLTLGWTAATDNVGVTSYDVLKAGTKVGSSTTPSYQLNGLTCGTSYSVGVRALDAAGNVSPLASASASTSPCASPAQTGFPNASNTGVPPGTTLHSCSGTINTTGTYDACQFNGPVIVNASNVKITRSLILGPVRPSDNQTGLVISDTTINCQCLSTNDNDTPMGILENNYTLLRVNLYNAGHGAGVKNNVLIQDSYIHDLGGNTQAHKDGIFIGDGHGSRIIHNTVECADGPARGCTAAIGIFDDFSDVYDFVIDGNLLNSNGAYCFYGSGGPSKPFSSHNITFTNNHFGRKFEQNCAVLGPVTYWDSSKPGMVWSGNVWDDTGQAVKPVY
jgi:chitodextrinase